MPPRFPTNESSPFRRELPVKFKIDENLPLSVRDALRDQGHDAMTVVDQGMGGTADKTLAQACTTEARVLITCDTDFGNILTYPPAQHAGIIVLSSAEQSIPAFAGLLGSVLSALATEQINHRLWIVEKDRIRIRGD